MPDLSLYQVGWFTQKLADTFSVILLRHVTNDKVIVTYLLFVLLELLFLIFFQDMNEINDQLDKEKIISIDEDLLPRTLFLVNSKR